MNALNWKKCTDFEKLIECYNEIDAEIGSQIDSTNTIAILTCKLYDIYEKKADEMIDLEAEM